MPVPPAINPAVALQQRFLLALSAIGVLLVCHQLVIQPALSRLATDAPVINIAGRQRMLSQRLSKSALTIERAALLGTTTHPAAWSELRAVLDLWQHSHQALQHGDTQLGLPGESNPVILQAFETLAPDFQAMAQAARDLLDLEQPRGPAADIQRAVQILLDHEPSFLQGMHGIVTSYESEARQRVYRLQRLGWLIMSLVLITLALVYWFAIVPSVHLLARKFQRKEELYRTLVESMHDGLLLADHTGQVQFVNARLSDMLGKPVEELIAQPLHKIIPATWMTSSSTTGLPIEFTLSTQAGQALEVLMTQRAVTDAERETQGLLLVLVDITALKQSQRETRELIQQLTHANRLKTVGAMAAGIAHEINQPLGAIANFAEGALTLLTRPVTDSTELTQALLRIQSATKRCAGVIHHVRDFSRQQTQVRAPADLHQLIHDVIELCLPDLKRERIALEFRFAQPLPLICVDAIQFQQILTNLIQNAVQAQLTTPNRPHWIRIGTELTETEAVIEVLDNGPGISSHNSAELFNPFVTTRPDGLGLGLSIVKSLVAAHAGWITVENAPPAGACFRFGLPVQPVYETALAPLNAAEATVGI